MTIAEPAPIEAEFVPPHMYEFRSSLWDRLFSAGVRAFWSGVVLWFILVLFFQYAPLGKFRPRAKQRMNLSTVLTLPLAFLIGAHRFASRFHTLRIREEQLELESMRRTVQLDPLVVDGLLAVDGIRLSGGEMIIWKQILLLAGGHAHALSFDPTANFQCYSVLREKCIHAWGLPFGGDLETPQAGPELSPEEYVDALGHLQRHFLLQTQKKLVTGLLMAGGGAIAIIALLMRMANVRSPRALLWLGIFVIVGLILVYRAVRQFGTLWKIRQVKHRLREAM